MKLRASDASAGWESVLVTVNSDTHTEGRLSRAGLLPASSDGATKVRWEYRTPLLSAVMRGIGSQPPSRLRASVAGCPSPNRGRISPAVANQSSVRLLVA